VQRPAFGGILHSLCIEGLGAGFEDGDGGCLQNTTEVAIVAGYVVKIGVNEIEAAECPVVEKRPQLGGCGGDGVEFVGERWSWSGFFGAFPAGHGHVVIGRGFGSSFW